MSQSTSEPTQPTLTATTEENGETQKSFPAELTDPIEVLMIDNFDSFTYNLYQYISLLGVSVTVIRNDAISPEDFPKLNIKYLVISPGPGHPSTDGGISQDAIKYFLGRVPVFGVCMGLECLVDVLGGDIR
jgi:anthranilate synthase/indole-3-glycerol phosphate synthase/phosphoribosylanthranilate isomerase